MIVKPVVLYPYVNRIYCKDCEKEMVREDIMLLTHPPKYRWFCSKCNKKITSLEDMFMTLEAKGKSVDFKEIRV